LTQHFFKTLASSHESSDRTIDSIPLRRCYTPLGVESLKRPGSARAC
jgi:hypothetical protein